MAGIVLQTVLRVMSRPWKWGEADCCTAACTVFAQLYGIDPAAEFRGRYATRAEAELLVHEAGGFARLLRAAARRHGLVPCGERIGALGVVAGEGLVVCAAPGLWLGKTECGFTTRHRARVGWHVPA